MTVAALISRWLLWSIVNKQLKFYGKREVNYFLKINSDNFIKLVGATYKYELRNFYFHHIAMNFWIAD